MRNGEICDFRAQKSEFHKKIPLFTGNFKNFQEFHEILCKNKDLRKIDPSKSSISTRNSKEITNEEVAFCELTNEEVDLVEFMVFYLNFMKIT